ncbi:hypothetical protein POM88_033090 [Heracleum sosnowskyi]|uniref:Remorin C-terminal domain-containing protein n=1 Tax=Heracleum sosnowskyi TaxID=360622 RepID=A0AAD8I0K0_9APIA|nr:hypothetical protein POM88_033090 [Heracleum sosnowskyi]
MFTIERTCEQFQFPTSHKLAYAARQSLSIKREEARITGWENLQKAKAEAAIWKLEMKLEKKRSSSMDKIMKKLKSHWIVASVGYKLTKQGKSIIKTTSTEAGNRNTRLRQEATKVGAMVVSGVEMFVGPINGQFKLFIGGLDKCVQ